VGNHVRPADYGVLRRRQGRQAPTLVAPSPAAVGAFTRRERVLPCRFMKIDRRHSSAQSFGLACQPGDPCSSSFSRRPTVRRCIMPSPHRAASSQWGPSPLAASAPILFVYEAG